ncbi:MAG: DUF5686 family protein, partial [Bacteroidota bacterium]
GTTKGASTNFEGYYKITTNSPGDSLSTSYIGYLPKIKLVEKGKVQQIDFQLTPNATTLEAVEIVYGEYENPAWEILRQIVKNKAKNDKRSLLAYNHESYTKIEIDVDNITDKFREKKIVKKITNVLDSIQRIAGEDGKPILPIFISESISDVYYNRDPERKKEHIVKSKVTGLGVTDGSTVSQLIGSSFQEYNFYKNWMKIVEKDFVSPLSESWKTFYDYDLQKERVLIDNIPCYQIAFTPKKPEDLAFIGNMWIADSLNNYALKQIDVSISASANLNFIEKIKIQQEYEMVVENGAWLPNKTRVIIDIGEVRDDWAGMLAKFYVSNKDFEINKPKALKFYDQELVLDERALISDDTYWEENRHDKLSDTEMNVYHMIDTMKNLPVIKTYVEIAEILMYGYKQVGKLDVGPYLYMYNRNNIEGHRFRMGFKTNADFSKKFIIRGYGAYGTKDERFKYSLSAEYIASRKPWTVFGVSHKKDIDQVGIFSDNLDNNPLFNSFALFGTLRRPYMHQINKFWARTDLLKGLTFQFAFRNRDIEPLFPFLYQKEGNDINFGSDFSVSELIFELRLAPGETFIQNDNNRISLGSGNKPVITFRYSQGIKDLLNSDFSFNRFDASLQQSFRLGIFGRTNYQLSGGYIPSTLPYPLLEAHLGNESAFFNENSFNMMDFFEFVSDKYASISLMHRFEGLIMNRVPLVKKWNWRLFMSGKALYGSVSDANANLTPETDEAGNIIEGFQALGNEPYVELSYGVENIFRFVRVDFIHRMNYLNENTNNFGVKFSLQFRL